MTNRAIEILCFAVENLMLLTLKKGIWNPRDNIIFAFSSTHLFVNIMKGLIYGPTDKQTFPYTTLLVLWKTDSWNMKGKDVHKVWFAVVLVELWENVLQSCSLSIIGANLLQTCRGLSYRHLFPSNFIDWSMIKNVKKMFKTVFRSPFINFGTSCSRVRINHLHCLCDNQRRSCWKTPPVKTICESENFNLET